jgi:hypothetical protein
VTTAPGHLSHVRVEVARSAVLACSTPSRPAQFRRAPGSPALRESCGGTRTIHGEPCSSGISAMVSACQRLNDSAASILRSSCGVRHGTRRNREPSVPAHRTRRNPHPADADLSHAHMGEGSSGASAFHRRQQHVHRARAAVDRPGARECDDVVDLAEPVVHDVLQHRSTRSGPQTLAMDHADATQPA